MVTPHLQPGVKAVVTLQQIVEELHLGEWWLIRTVLLEITGLRCGTIKSFDVQH